jgi:hypothetical protein
MAERKGYTRVPLVMTQSSKNTSAGDARTNPTRAPARHETPSRGASEGDARVAPQNAEKDPSDWSTGGETMTGPQASYLQTLCQEAGEPFDPNMSKAEASIRIDQLQSRTGRGRDH